MTALPGPKDQWQPSLINGPITALVEPRSLVLVDGLPTDCHVVPTSHVCVYLFPVNALSFPLPDHYLLHTKGGETPFCFASLSLSRGVCFQHGRVIYVVFSRVRRRRVFVSAGLHCPCRLQWFISYGDSSVNIITTKQNSQVMFFFASATMDVLRWGHSHQQHNGIKIIKPSMFNIQ